MPPSRPNGIDRIIIRRKADRLVSALKMTKEDINEFFLHGLLPAKRISEIEGLDSHPNEASMSKFVVILEEDAKEGSVLALANILEATSPMLSEDLMGDLDLVEGKLTVDEATLDESATMTHRDFGSSRRLGPVDQKTLAALLGGRVVSTRSSCRKQLARFSMANHDELLASEYRDERAKQLVETMSRYTKDRKIPSALKGSFGAPNTDRAIIELNHLLEDVFNHLREGLNDVEKMYDEKQKTKKILEAVERRSYDDTDPLDHVIISLLQRRRREMDFVRSKLRVIDDRVSESYESLQKAKQDRPVKVANKSETKEKMQEKLAAAKKKHTELVARERGLKTELDQLRSEINDVKMKMKFVSKSRTVKSIRMSEKLKSRQMNGEMLSASLTDLHGREGGHLYDRDRGQRNYKAFNNSSWSSAKSYTSEDSDRSDEYS